MFTVGIDLGGTNIAIGLCDEKFNIVDKDSTPTLARRAAELIVDDMAALTEKIIRRNGLSPNEIAGVGIATPGSVDDATGTVLYSNNIPFSNLPLARLFKERLAVKRVTLLNDADAAALGETIAGAARGAKCAVMITLGTGIGGGIVMDGKVHTGTNNAAGELGHTVISMGGRQCTCGRRGCFEAYASATALSAITEEKMQELRYLGIDSELFRKVNKQGRATARTAFDAMRAGDKYGKQVVDEYITYLAEGVTNMINIFQPDVLIIGGGICNERENLTRPLTSLVELWQYTRHNKIKTKIVTAELGNDAGIVGAAGAVE